MKQAPTKSRCLSLVLLAATLSTAWSQEPQAPTTEDSKEYKLRALALTPSDSGGLFFIDGEVEGKKTRFLLDTGCNSSSVYDTSLIRSLGKELVESDVVHGVGGKRATYTTKLDKVVIGGQIAASSPSSTVMDVPQLENQRIKGEKPVIGGLIGSPLLKAAKAILDYETARLLVPPADAPADLYANHMRDSGGRLIPLLKNNYNSPLVKCRIGDRHFAFLIDSGANSNSIEPDVVEKLKAAQEDSGKSVLGIHEQENARFVTLEGLFIGDLIQLADLKCYVIDAMQAIQIEDGTPFGGILGTHALKAMKGKLDYGTYQLILPPR